MLTIIFGFELTPMVTTAEGLHSDASRLGHFFLCLSFRNVLLGLNMTMEFD